MLELILLGLVLAGVAALVGKEFHQRIKYGGSTFLQATGLTATNTATVTNKVYQAPREVVVALSDTATPALDASLGTLFTLTATGDRTIAVPTNPPPAGQTQKIMIRHLASGGARTLALNTGAGGFRFGSDITALTQTVSGKTDYIGCVWNVTDSFWDVVAYVKGF